MYINNPSNLYGGTDNRKICHIFHFEQSLQMGQLKRCFFTLEEDGSEPITLVFKLFCRSLPKTTGNFIKLCTGKYGGDELHCSYKNTLVTRIIAPEYIVQLGRIDRRSKKTIHRLGGVVDEQEYTEKGETIRDKVKFKHGGYLCAIAGKSSPFEFFITLTDLRKYRSKELLDYLAIGELEAPSLDILNDWLQKREVDRYDEPVEECRIVRSGELVFKEESPHGKKSVVKENTKEKATVHKKHAVDAYTALFG